MKIKVVNNLLRTFLLGWWSLPWGLINIFFIIDNIYKLIWPFEEKAEIKEMERFLSEVDIDINDILLGEDGLSKSQREFMQRLSYVLFQAINADGEWHKDEEARAIKVICSNVNDILTPIQAKSLLDKAGLLRLDLLNIDEEEKIMLLQEAIILTGIDGVLKSSEREYLYNLGLRLGLHKEFIDSNINKILFDKYVEELSEELEHACNIMNLSIRSSLKDIKNRYREMMLINHPDVAHGLPRSTAEATAKKINWAYKVLKDHAKVNPL
ncbi:J domain-containing protein [Hymenobacter defluvii]|uniref:J domain-containing protein n=1 Tax=Hymenobacter defluvii TaxID=2054411 RepID=UPI001AAF114C